MYAFLTISSTQMIKWDNLIEYLMQNRYPLFIDLEILVKYLRATTLKVHISEITLSIALELYTSLPNHHAYIHNQVRLLYLAFNSSMALFTHFKSLI